MSLSHQLVTLNNSSPIILTTPADQEIPYANSLSMSIQNVGSDLVYIGSSSVNSASYGFKLSPGQTFSIDIAPNDDLYGITDSGSSAVAVLRVVK